MGIELRLLRSFAAVAEEQHVGNAAARLYISQPALSQQIRALEEQVGVPLFVRHARGVELTEAGEALLQEARAVLANSERLEATVDELRRGRATGLRIGMPPGLDPTLATPHWLAGVAGVVSRPLTDVRIEIRTAAAWRPANRSPLLKQLIALLPAADQTTPAPETSDAA